MNKISIGGYNRILKQTARKRYNEGKTVYITACKLSPVNMYAPAACMGGYEASGVVFGFDKEVNAFEYYNCNYETGYYAAFYVKGVN